MYVCVYKSRKGDRYVRVDESYRDEHGKVKHRTVKQYGRLDAQLEKNPNFLHELKARYSEERQARLNAATALHLNQAAEVLNQAQTADTMKPFPLFRYGHLALRNIWNNVLGLDQKLTYLQKTKLNIRYDLNRVVSYLTFMKVLDPHSILHCFGDKDDFLGDPAKDVTLDNCYDSYGILKEYKGEILKTINKRLDRVYGSDRATLIFYDVTNAYFEAPMTDQEMELDTDDFAQAVSEYAQQCRCRVDNPLPETCFDPETGELIVKQLPDWFLEEIEDEKIQYLRMRGPSKEHRTDLPIVSIALVIDRYGIPMDFEVYSGHSSEFRTMKKSIAALKKIYKIRNAIVVADRGLNSAKNLQMLLENELGFLVAQKVTNLGESLTKIMLNLDSYTPIDEDHPSAGKYYEYSNWAKHGSEGESVKCKLVFTWNEARKKRDETILDLMVEIVKRKQAEGKKIGPRKTGWAQFAMVADDADQDILGVNEALVEQKRKLCGFAAMVYREPTNTQSDCPTSGAEIAGLYHQLNRIEDGFRVMKSNLGLRPMYVRKSDHIRGHVMVCFLALILVRLIQDRLDKQKTHLSVHTICRTLDEAMVMAWKTPKDLYFANTRMHSNARRGRERIKTQDLRTMVEQGQITIDYTADVLKACGLSPLPRLGVRAEVARALGARWPAVTDAIPELRLHEL